MKKALCILMLSVLVCAFVLPYAALAEGGVPQAVLDLRKSVVRVICRAADGGGTGSGFAIGTEEPVKYIVTNLHVVDQNRNGVTILRENNREIKASVYLQLEHADLCVLLLDEALYGVPPIPLQDEKTADVGQAVYALGFPGAADDLSDKATGDPEDVTVTDGIVSAVKSLTLTLTQDGEPVSLLQINAAINHGNSGGPLVDDRANVLGINTLGIETAQNVNGAISIRELTGALRERGIVYLSASDGKAGFPLITVVITGSALLLAVAALLTILLVRRPKKKVRKTAPAQGVPLPVYLKQWGGRLPYGMAARVLAPALRALAALHAAGRMHGDICPETISVDPNSVQAALRPPESNAPGGRLVLRPGFSSPEQYRADGRLGPWSDVYSMSAVFHYAITGAAPRGAMERMAQGGETIDLAQTGLGEAQAAALFAGLALDAGKRPQNAAELAAALGVDLTAAAPAVLAVAAPAAAARPVKKRMKTGRKLLIAGAAALFLLCAGAGGYYLYLDSHYNEAVECIRKQDYKGGIDHLHQVLQIYKSSGQWMNYACAGYALQQNDFLSARQGFARSGDFNNAKDMLKEVDYLEAYYLLMEGQYRQAKDKFILLANYKDSKQMILEVDYQKAQYLLNIKDYSGSIEIFILLADKNYKNSSDYIIEANYSWAITLYQEQKYLDSLDKFRTISDYKDTPAFIESIIQELTSQAIHLYRDGQYSNAGKLFKIINEYYDASAYIDLIAAHMSNLSNAIKDYSKMRDLYKRLFSLGSFEDAQELLKSDLFFLYRLEGVWSDSGHKNTISLVYTQQEWKFVISINGYETTEFSLWGLTINNYEVINGDIIWIAAQFNDDNHIKMIFLERFHFNMIRQ